MADAVVVTKIWESRDDVAFRFTNISDATGEANVAKVVRANFKTPDGQSTALSLDVRSIRWTVQGMTNVQLKWDHTAPDLAYVMAGAGMDVPSNMPDPRSAGGTGNLTITTVGAVAGGSYDITVILNKRAT